MNLETPTLEEPSNTQDQNAQA
jgi:NSS family neurotransmitter:Na+ symporter